VLRATDKFQERKKNGTKTPRDVVLKLMKEEDQFKREIEKRIGLDPSLVVEVICTSDDFGIEGGRSKWGCGLEKIHSPLQTWTNYQFGIVMPAAECNLLTVLLQESVDLTLVKKIFSSLAEGLQHLHENERIHGDFKPGNVVRMVNGQWMLIDMDGAVSFDAPVGAKALSTAFVGPETTYKSENQEIGFRVPQKDNTVSKGVAWNQTPHDATILRSFTALPP
jgi:serine/threonine protein kinase